FARPREVGYREHRINAVRRNPTARADRIDKPNLRLAVRFVQTDEAPTRQPALPEPSQCAHSCLPSRCHRASATVTRRPAYLPIMASTHTWAIVSQLSASTMI